MEEISFYEWYTENEKEAGALVTMTMAGQMLGTTRQYIQNLAANKKIKTYTYDTMRLVGLRDIERVIKKRKQRIEKQRNLKRITYQNGLQEAQTDIEELINFIKEKCPEKAKEFGLI